MDEIQSSFWELYLFVQLIPPPIITIIEISTLFFTYRRL